MWDIVCQLNVYLRTYKTASPRGGELASLVATASNSSLVCATSASSTRQSRVLAAAALADNDSPHTAPRIRSWSRETGGGALRSPICFCSLEDALRFSSRRRLRNGVAGEGNGLGTTARPGLGLLGCGRCPCPDVPESPCLMLFPRFLGGGGFPAGVLCSRCSTRAYARTHPAVSCCRWWR